MKVNVIKDSGFEKIAEGVKPDAKKRVVLPGRVREGITYHIYENNIGQIILDPQVSIPASEAWLYKNPEVLESVRHGLKDLAEGRTKKVNPGEFQE
jgi:hypothetical protein